MADANRIPTEKRLTIHVTRTTDKEWKLTVGGVDLARYESMSTANAIAVYIGGLLETPVQVSN